jgi:tetratricopeptide (TPR) repeat protein
MSQPNDALASLLDEAGMSQAGLAARVNALGKSLKLTYDYTSVYRWKKGESPRSRQVRELIACALAERLGRPVSLVDIGMSSAEPDRTTLGLIYDNALDGALTTLTRLWQADLDDSVAVKAPPVPSAWIDASLSWLVRAGSDPLSENAGSAKVGAADIEAVRATADAFASLDNQFGGGRARRALIQYLRTEVATLLAGRYNEQTGRELFSAAAEATLLAAWATYDAGDSHGLAQRYFVQALRLAQAADNVLLAGSILDAMSHQATFLGRYREAANLARAARTGTAGVATATLTAHFHAMEARALAAAGDASGADRALGDAVRMFERRRPGDDPEWIAYVDESELSAEFSHCYRDTGRAADSITYAQRCLDAGPSSSARSDFFVTMVLAEGYLAHGELEQACATARQALDIGQRLKSARCAEYLRHFRHGVQPFAETAVVRELAERGTEHPLWIAAA